MKKGASWSWIAATHVGNESPAKFNENISAIQSDSQSRDPRRHATRNRPGQLSNIANFWSDRQPSGWGQPCNNGVTRLTQLALTCKSRLDGKKILRRMRAKITCSAIIVQVR